MKENIKEWVRQFLWIVLMVSVLVVTIDVIVALLAYLTNQT